MKESISQIWKNDEWVDDRKTFIEYDNNDFVTKNTSLKWDFAKEKWRKNIQFIYEYDDHKNQTLYIKKKVDNTGDDWNNVEKFLFYWSPFEINKLSQIKNVISVFPNPTSNIIYFDIGESLDNKVVSIYSSAGRLVLEKTIYGNQIDISSLKNGIYYINILIDKKIFMTKFVVE